MADLSKYSDEQLRKFSAGDYSEMTTEDLQEFSAKSKPLTPGESVKGFLAQAAKGVTPAPEAYAGIANIIAGSRKGMGADWFNRYEAGKKGFEETAERFQQANPKTALAANIGGGLTWGAGGVGKKLLTEAAKKSVPLAVKAGKMALSGMGYGGLYGGGAQASNVGELIKQGKYKEALKSGGAGTGVGAAIGALAAPVTGAGLYLGSKLLKGGVNMLRPLFGRESKTAAEQVAEAMAKESPKGEVKTPSELIEETVGKNAAEKSVKEGKSLLETGGKEVRRLALQAKLNNDEAADILETASVKHLQDTPGKLKAALNKVFGEKTPRTNLEEIGTHYTEQAKPLYDEVMQTGNILTLPHAKKLDLGILKDPIYQVYEKQMRNPNEILSRGFNDAPSTDIRMIDAVKKAVDADYVRFKDSGDRARAAGLLKLHDDIIKLADEAVPKYKLARETAGDFIKMREAQDLAAEYLTGKKQSVEDIKALVDAMKPAEKESFYVGVKQALNSMIDDASKGEFSNPAHKVFGTHPGYIMRQRLQAILGDKKYGQLMNDVEAQVNMGNNIQKLMTGSQTAEKEGLRITGITRTLKNVASKALTAQSRAHYVDVARMLTSPTYLAEVLAREKPTPSIIPKITKTQSPRIGGIYGGQKSEEGGAK